MKTTTALCSDTNRGARPLLPAVAPASRPTALSLTVRRGFCKARGEEEEEVSGKLELGASSLPRNHHQRQSDGRRRHAERREKGSPPPAVRTKKTVEPPRALLSPSLQLSGAHSPPSPPQPAFILQYISRKQRSKTSEVGGNHGCCRRRDERP